MLPLRFLSKRNFTYAADPLHTKGFSFVTTNLRLPKKALHLKALELDSTHSALAAMDGLGWISLCPSG